MNKEQLIKLRESIQRKKNIGITAAQLYCAGLVKVKLRTFQSWEYGERKMPEGLWELIQIKTSR